MKKTLIALIATVGLMAALPVATFAANPGNPTQTIVTGTVTKSGNPVVGASVSVNCDGNILVDSATDSSGDYQVTYVPASLCPIGATAVVTSTGPGGLHGSNSGEVSKVTTKINIDEVDVSVVPELGAITATTAIVIGAGSFLVVRRKHANTN